MIFIEIDKVYDKMPSKVLWKVMEKKGVWIDNIRAFKYMNDRVVTSCRTQSKVIEDYHIIIGL